MKLFILILAAAACVAKESDVVPDVVSYLNKYGYLNPHSYADTDQITLAIKDLQSNAGLEQTGVVDDELLKLMATPRCGNDDKKHTAFKGLRFSPYAANGQVGQWHKLKITYAFESYTPDLPRSTTEKIIAEALDMWAKVTNVEFRLIRDTKTADIRINFDTYQHMFVRDNRYCSYSFDGPGGTLAHAFYPTGQWWQGGVHFDDDEYYTNRQSNGRDLFYVAAHEFGHTLGLDHSDEKKDLMYPWYQYVPTLKDLPYGDQFRIQSIYGAKVTEKTTAPLPTVSGKCPAGWVFAGRSCYLDANQKGTFYDAKKVCQSKGAHMVSIHDLAENRLFAQMAKEKKRFLWLGLTDEKVEGDWVWTDGSKTTFKGFTGSEGVRNYQENCALMDWYEVKWQDWPCDTKHYIFCEQKPL